MYVYGKNIRFGREHNIHTVGACRVKCATHTHVVRLRTIAVIQSQKNDQEVRSVASQHNHSDVRVVCVCFFSPLLLWPPPYPPSVRPSERVPFAQKKRHRALGEKTPFRKKRVHTRISRTDVPFHTLLAASSKCCVWEKA